MTFNSNENKGYVSAQTFQENKTETEEVIFLCKLIISKEKEFERLIVLLEKVNEKKIK